MKNKTLIFDFERYPEIGYANFKCVLCAFKQQLALKMGVYCRLFLFSYKIVFLLWLSGYGIMIATD